MDIEVLRFPTGAVPLGADIDDGGFRVERAPRPEPSQDTASSRRRFWSPIVAFLLHVAIILLLLFGLPWHAPEAPPPSIPVEIVMTPPPPPKAPPVRAPKPPPAPPVPKPPPAPASEPMESGGSPELSAGRPAAKAAPKEGGETAKPVPPTKAPPAEKVRGRTEPKTTKKEAPAPKPAHAAATPQYETPFMVRHSEEKAPKQEAALPEKNKPLFTYPPGAPSANEASGPEFSDSARRGEGGGNRYLNAMRDTILSNLLYPSSAQGAVGVAHYRIVVSRSGDLVMLRLLESTGVPALDRAGSDAIQNSAPFQPLPANIRGEAVAINVTLYIGPRQ